MSGPTMQQFHVLQLTAEEAKREATIAEALKKHGLPGNLAKRAKDDPTAPFYFLDKLTALAAAEPPVWERLRAQLKVAGTRLGALDRLIHASDKAGGDTRRTQAGDLMGIVDDGCGLFHDGESNGFADVENDGHRETWPVRSQGFSRWLRHRYFEKHNGAPNNEALQSALGTIESMAQFEGESMSVHRRRRLNRAAAVSRPWRPGLAGGRDWARRLAHHRPPARAVHPLGNHPGPAGAQERRFHRCPSAISEPLERR